MPVPRLLAVRLGPGIHSASLLGFSVGVRRDQRPRRFRAAPCTGPSAPHGQTGLDRQPSHNSINESPQRIGFAGLPSRVRAGGKRRRISALGLLDHGDAPGWSGSVISTGLGIWRRPRKNRANLRRNCSPTKHIETTTQLADAGLPAMRRDGFHSQQKPALTHLRRANTSATSFVLGGGSLR